jgi:hypothetical protein
VDQEGRKVERESEGSVKLVQLFRREMANIVGERGLWEADKVITMNAAVMLESLLDTDSNLAVKAISTCVDGSTDNA